MVIKAKTACGETSIIYQIMVGIFSIGVLFCLFLTLSILF